MIAVTVRINKTVILNSSFRLSRKNTTLSAPHAETKVTMTVFTISELSFINPVAKFSAYRTQKIIPQTPVKEMVRTENISVSKPPSDFFLMLHYIIEKKSYPLFTFIVRNLSFYSNLPRFYRNGCCIRCRSALSL